MPQPSISIIIPCLNEENFIEEVISNILEQDISRDNLEVYFVDGMSKDKTREIIKNYSKNYPFIHLLDNPARFVPQAMNKAIRASQGEIIIRLDAHASYPVDYISKLVQWSQKTKADNVGGVWNTVPRSDTSLAKAISLVLSHPVGVGNASFRLGVDQPTEADTVPFGCFRRETFEKFGYYDERLHRNQDIELNKRIVKQGGKILLVPDVFCNYFSRDTLSSLWKNNFDNGKWVILTAFYTKTLNSLSLRHFVPLFFVLYFLGLSLVFISQFFFFDLEIFFYISIIPAALYLLIILLISFQISIKYSNLGLFLNSFLSFLVLHFSYGFGSLKGILKMKNIS